MKDTLTGLWSTGKRVGQALYLHISAVDGRDTAVQRSIDAAVRLAAVERQAFNVVKLHASDPHRISLLAYQSFDAHPFPALLDSWTVDTKANTSSHRSYRASRNPPILHRKELLLPSDDPRRAVFVRLTKTLEDRGLFENPKSIGFRRQWETRLRNAGLTVVEHEVAELSVQGPRSSEQRVVVQRFRTAISRSTLSAPMQALHRHGLLGRAIKVFDYGCGRGDDIAALTAAGLESSGWDPHYAPDAPLKESDVVNLGFVLNVIEDPAERIEVLRRAFALARSVLSIAVLTAGREDVSRCLPHGDGYLSSRGTFQKHFAHGETQALVRNAIGQEAIPVAPGVYFAFRDKIIEQEFLEGRRHRDREAVFGRPRPPIAKRPIRRTPEALLEENRELVEAVWVRALELGRFPELDELHHDVAQEILTQFGSLARATRMVATAYQEKALKQRASARTDDLTLYFALNLFGERKRYRKLPTGLQRDVRAFFGSYANAEATGRSLLFSLSNTSVLHEAATKAHAEGIGCFDGQDAMQVDVRLADRLPTVLRAYIGCAEQIYGDIEQSDLIKIHVASQKLTLLKCNAYETSPLPLLRERVKIDLRRQTIRYHDHARNRRAKRLLYMKSRYMDQSLPGYRRQREFDRKLASLGLLGPEAPDPAPLEFARLLWNRKLAIRGFDIVPRVVSAG